MIKELLLLAIFQLISLAHAGRYTALHFAAESGDVEDVKKAYRTVGDIDCVDPDGYTPLLKACAHNKVDLANIVKYLIEQGASINRQTPTGRHTALMLAIDRNELAAVKVLLEKNADTAIKGNTGFTALHCAAHHTNLEMVKLVAEKSRNIDPVDDYNDTPLHKTALFNDMDPINIVTYFVEKGADVDHQTKTRDTPLMAATRRNHLPLVKALLDLGASTAFKDKDGYTPLHWAAFRAGFEVMKVLVRASKSVDPLNHGGCTPLHDTLKFNTVDPVRIAKFLIGNGADVNKVNNYRSTPMTYARDRYSQQHKQELIDLLKQHGAKG